MPTTLTLSQEGVWGRPELLFGGKVPLLTNSLWPQVGKLLFQLSSATSEVLQNCEDEVSQEEYQFDHFQQPCL